MSTRDWEAAFFALSALLGEPLEASLAAAGEPAAADAQELVRELRSSQRERRARAIARTVARVALEIDAMELS